MRTEAIFKCDCRNCYECAYNNCSGINGCACHNVDCQPRAAEGEKPMNTQLKAKGAANKLDDTSRPDGS